MLFFACIHHYPDALGLPARAASLKLEPMFLCIFAKSFHTDEANLLCHVYGSISSQNTVTEKNILMVSFCYDTHIINNKMSKTLHCCIADIKISWKKEPKHYVLHWEISMKMGSKCWQLSATSFPPLSAVKAHKRTSGKKRWNIFKQWKQNLNAVCSNQWLGTFQPQSETNVKYDSL